MNEETLSRLRDMKLTGMLAALQEQRANPNVASLTFEERLAMLVDAEWLQRHNRRITRHLRDAKLRLASACLEELDYDEVRQINKPLIRELATCRWVTAHHNIAITGATGTGKTFLACALAQHAIRRRFRAVYRRTTRLLDELALARADGTYVRALARLARVDVLILDDWGMVTPDDHGRRDLNELLEDRSGERSTIITSQYPVELWHDQIGDPTTADAICDRVLARCHRIVLQGPSRRKENPTAN